MWGDRAALDGPWDATHLEPKMIRQTHSGGGRDDHDFNPRRCVGPVLLHMDGVVAARG